MAVSIIIIITLLCWVGPTSVLIFQHVGKKRVKDGERRNSDFGLDPLDADPTVESGRGIIWPLRHVGEIWPLKAEGLVYGGLHWELFFFVGPSVHRTCLSPQIRSLLDRCVTFWENTKRKLRGAAMCCNVPATSDARWLDEILPPFWFIRHYCYFRKFQGVL